MSRPSSYLKLTAKQRIYVDSRLAGMNKTASAAAAGCPSPNKDYGDYDVATEQAMIDCMNQTAEEVDFGRKEAHEMYMDAHQNAETATEQVAAINALVKLHGLEAPKVVQVNHDHTHTGQIEFLPNDELMKLADMEDLTLEGEYEVVGEAPKLAAPEATDDNTQPDDKILRQLPSDY